MNVSKSLLPLLIQIDPSITDYKIINQINQSNAEGNLIETWNKNGKKEYFIKQIIASNYNNKSWADLRRTLMYARTEIRFYKDFLPLFVYPIAPHCYYADYSMKDLEKDKVTDVNLEAPKNWNIENVYGYMALESMSDYIQESPLSIEKAKLCLKAVAKMHASTWENISLLKKASIELTECGGSYHLRIRNPKEYQQLKDSWTHFCNEFHSSDNNLFQQTRIQKLGERIYDIAEYVSKELTPLYNDPYATIVHGDYKAMNVFLPKDYDEKKVKIIDFASTGLGVGMSDVAFHIAHAVHPLDLKDNEMELLDTYLEALEIARKESNTNQKPYPYDVAIRHYKLASIDYFRFVLGRFWKSATLETFEKRKNCPNVVLLNRNVDAAFAFIKRVETYLSEFENEM